MWKNKQNRDELRCPLYTAYSVDGYNLDRLLNLLHSRKIEVYSAKKVGNTKLILNIRYGDNKNFLALTKELCYNIKKIKDGGRLYPFLYLYKNLGIVIGAVLFVAFTFLFNDYLLGFEFSGTGSIYAEQVKEYLTSRNVKEFSKFSSLDLKELANGVLQNNERLTFVSCQKVGNTLKFNLVLSSEKVPILSQNVKQLFADEDGEIIEIKVYRGTEIFHVGDYVKKGELLVDGYSIIKEQRVETNVLAYVKLKCEKTFVYESQKDGEDEFAIVFAKEEYPEITPSKEIVVKEKIGDKYAYRVTLEYVHGILTD